MEAPVNTSDPNNMAGILINNLVKEEDILRQRSPLDSNIFAKLRRKLNVSCLPDLEQRTLFNLVALGRYIGPRVSKYAQTTDKKVDYHVYPSGKQVIKAFTANNFHFLTRIVKLLQNYLTPPLRSSTEFISPGVFRKITRTIRQ
jgi:hypothetical protein